MRIPVSTYRIQFNPAFGFEAAKRMVSYLAQLGISDLYASPIFKSREGSTHGYDVVDPNLLNPALGTNEEFDALMNEVQQQGMGWLQDIVPNHMAYDSENKYLIDVLENGPDSEYFNYFDIDWEHPYVDIKGKLLTPLLGDFCGNCLERGEIQLKYDESGFNVNYYSLKIPLRIESYAKLITHDLGRLGKSLGRKHPDFIKLLGILYILKNITTETSGKQRKDQVNFVKGLLWELYQDKPEVQEFIDHNIKLFNGEAGNPESFNLLDDLLSEQFFRLSFWKVGAEELNYRRFFTINELMGVRAEDLNVFNKTHSLIFQLVESGKFTGLRIDHIDGLYNPGEYLQRLREKAGDIYIVVEKILELERQYYSNHEEMPAQWPIQGTSGYEFVNCLNSLFCKGDNYRQFNDIYLKYLKFTGLDVPYEHIVADKKRLIADRNLAGDVENLANLLKKIAGTYRYGRDFTLNGLRKAILEVLLQFPVYRTYINQEGIREADKTYIHEIIQKAKVKLPQLAKEISFIEKILSLDYEESLSKEEKAQWTHFAMRLQQFTGPLMAKGVEDTALYVYNRLISLNEVGGTPSLFGIPVSVFHSFNQKFQERWPHSMNASSTHDTKRSEDVRARINVISEIPDEWEAQVNIWSELNRNHKVKVSGQIFPTSNDEYFLYQTIVGAFPFYENEYSLFIQRIKDYAIKAVREAKVNTDWLRPDSDYEEALLGFIDKILQPNEDNEFLAKLRSFQERVAHYGIFNSLSQTLLKIAAPGVPDFYQGTELWDSSLVDPDNRRSVDFEKRSAYLQDIKQRSKTDILGLISELISNRQDGRLKLFTIARALEARNKYQQAFQEGAYIPLEILGKYHEHIVAFARHHHTRTAIAIVPRFLTSMIQPMEFPLGEEIWADTRIEIPQALQANWKNAITAQEIADSETISIGKALEHFPLALLISEAGTED